MLLYYLYTHTRLDTNQVFYVGIGRTPNKNQFIRAYEKATRSEEWLQIINDCKYNYKVDIVKTFITHEECCLEEIKLIEKLGRSCKGKGCLVNKAPGGHKWKDCIKVYQYDFDGNYIAEWISPKIAESILKIRYSTIYASCKNLTSAGKYQFRTFKVNKIQAYKHKQKKVVYKYTKLGKYICSFESIADAAKSIKISPTRLGECIKKNKSAKNFLWSFSNKSCTVKRIIYQYDSKGNIIGLYTSLPEAAKGIGVTSINSIDNAIKGIKQKQAYGYTWGSAYNVEVINYDQEEKNM